MEIQCRKGNCTHNNGNSCCAKAVKICQDTAECETFDPSATKKPVTVGKGNMFATAKKIPTKRTLNVPLKCDATNCLFNKRENCTSNGINVVDDGATSQKLGASCATFVKD